MQLSLKRKGGLVDGIMPALVIPLMLIIMIVVYAQFSTSIDRAGWSSAANTSYTKIDTQAYNSFNLATILPIVVVGVLILSVVVKAFVL